LILVLALFPRATPSQTPGPERAEADSLFGAGNWEAAAAAYEDWLAQNPEDGPAWFRLAAARYRLEDYMGSAAAYQRAEALETYLPITRYNLACDYALLGKNDDAFAALERAVEMGTVRAPQLDSDEDLASLREDPRWKALVEAADRKTRPCEYDDSYRRFDFWIGSWNVFTPSGAQAGTSRIEAAVDGCLVIENWEGRYGPGKSFNFYDAAVGLWKQTWMGHDGEVLEFLEIPGGPEGASLRFLARVPGEDGSVSLRRMTFFSLAPDRVRQLIETSDDGEAWTTAFDGTYVRAE